MRKPNDQPTCRLDDQEPGLRDTCSFDDIRQQCSTYSLAIAARNVASLRDLVDNAPADARPALLRNLLHLDLERRRAAGEFPVAADYLATFPQFTNLVLKVFYEIASNAGERAGSGAEHPMAEKPSINLLNNGNLLGDYRLLRELGRGGMGTVYEALHLQTKHRVALKTLPAVDGTRLHLFKKEFRTMTEVNHPNLIGLHSLESDGAYWFFTMDLITGTDFLSFVRPDQKLDPHRLFQAFTQLTVAIMFLHGRGIVHRDLKPSNVMVAEDGRLVVLDFGLLLTQTAHDETNTQHVAGTPAYMAPEQATGSGVTGAADWYAVGTMLYEALAGHRPFQARNPMQLLAEKQNQDPLPVTLGPDVPSGLADLSLRMLSRDPSQRPDAFEVCRFLGSTSPPAPNRHVETSSLLLGRETQLAQMNRAFERARYDRKPQVIFVSGRSGEGKTTLVEHFLHNVKGRDGPVTVICGRCYDRESVPFKALDSLLDALASHLRRIPEAEAALMMPDDISFLARLFPVLRRVSAVDRLAVKDISRLDQGQVRARAFAAFRAFLGRVASQNPLVLFCDDLQWGDADSAEVLSQALQPPEAPDVVMIGSYRSDEFKTSPFLQKWARIDESGNQLQTENVSVAPLTPNECLQMTIAIVGQDSEVIQRCAFEVFQQTGGNPFLLNELVSCFDPLTESFQFMPIQDVIESKLSRLPSEARPLLEIIAVSGKSLVLAEATKTSGNPQDATSAVTHMRSENLLRLIGTDSDARVDTYHDKIRETVLAEMQLDRRRTLHSALGCVIEADCLPTGNTGPEGLLCGDVPVDHLLAARLFDLSYHFDAAGDSQRACAYAILAGEQASGQFAQKEAAVQFGIALRNAPPQDPEKQFRISCGNGRALCLLGDYDAATTVLEGVVELTDDPVEQAQVLGLRAEIAHKQGHIGQGIELYTAALQKLGQYVPRSSLGVFAALGYESLVQLFHTILPKWCFQRPVPLNRRQELVVELANRKSIVSYYSNVPRMIWSHLKGLNLAETRLSSRGLAYAYGLHPAPVSAIGLPARGLRYNDRALELAEESGDLLTKGHCLAMRSMAYYSRGQHAAAVDSAQRSIDVLTKAGDPYVIFVAECHASFSSTRLGNIEAAVKFATTGFERATKFGQHSSNAGLLLAWALATDGNLPFRELRECFRVSSDDHFSTSLVGIAEGIWHLRSGRIDPAVDALEAACHCARKNLVILPYTVAGCTWLTNALRRRLELADTLNAADRRRLRKRAWRSVRNSVLLSRMYPSERIYALREMALLHLQDGRPTRARRLLLASIELAKRHGDLWQHALSCREHGRLTQLSGKPEELRLTDADAVIKRIRSAMDGLVGSRSEVSNSPTDTHIRN